jgi:hypothetical protein
MEAIMAAPMKIPLPIIEAMIAVPSPDPSAPVLHALEIAELEAMLQEYTEKACKLCAMMKSTTAATTSPKIHPYHILQV